MMKTAFMIKSCSSILAIKKGRQSSSSTFVPCQIPTQKTIPISLSALWDHDNDIVGVDFFDDAKLQNLVNAYLDNPPLVLYENIHFPHLPEGKVVGLVTCLLYTSPSPRD